jgi:hypothetical protein
MKKAAASDSIFKKQNVGFCNTFYRREFYKQRAANNIDTRIGALGCQNPGYQEFPWLLVLQGAVRVRVRPGKDGDHLFRLPPFI